MLRFESTGVSNSHEFRATIRRALTRLSLFGTYALGSSRSDTDGPYTVAANARTLQGEYGRSAEDERHHLLFGGNVDLPADISISGLLTIGSGRPFNITTGRDNDGDLVFVDRPGPGSPGAPGVVSTQLGDFNVLRSESELMIPRNAGQGPGQFVLNMGVAKVIRLASASTTTDRSARYVVLTVSAENITNRVNFADFNGVVTSPRFAMANRALNPRRIEVGVRFGF
jgi:hypothetical protein